MPANQASLASADLTEASTEAQPPPQEPLKFSVGAVMGKLGLPQEIRNAIKGQAEPEPEVEKPVEEEVPAPKEDEVPEPKDKPDEEEKEDEPLPDAAKAERKAEHLLKRVDKLTAQREEARSRAEALQEELENAKAKLEEASQPVVAPSLDDPLASVRSETDLQQVYREAKIQRDWARKYRNGVTLNEGKENERQVTEEEMADYLSQAEDMLLEHLPRKRAQLQAQTQFDSLAKETFPSLFDRSSEDYSAARNIINRLPWLASLPERNFLIGDYLEGLKARLARQAKNGKPEVKNDLNPRILEPVPPIAESTPRPPVKREVPRSKKIEEADTEVVKRGGDVRSIANAIKARWDTKQGASRREPVSV